MIKLSEAQRWSERIEQLLAELSPHDQAVTLAATLVGTLHAMCPRERDIFVTAHITAMRACMAILAQQDKAGETRH